MVMNITGGFMQPSTTVPALGSGNLFAYSGTVGAPVPISAYRASIGTNWSDDPTVDDRKNFITANKARISSMGWRLTYTGPAASCSGVITVNSNSLITDPMMLKLNNRIGNIIADGTVGANLDTTANPIKVVPTVPFYSQAYSSSAKDTVTLRPEMGARGVVRHNAPQFNWSELYDQGFLLTVANDGANQMGGDLLNAVANAYAVGPFTANKGTVALGSLNFYDQDWDSVNIVLTGVTGSFRFEQYTCVEYIPFTTSILRELATVTKAASPQTVAAVDKAVANKPVAEPTT